MKINNPTNVTITSITDVNGSSTQPSFNVASPNWNHGKLKTSRADVPCPAGASLCANAHNESRNESAIVPIVIVAAKRRCALLVTDSTAAAARGSTGISQRFCAIQLI